MALELPSWGGAADDSERTRRVIAEWAASEPMRRIVDAFGGSTLGVSGGELLGWLDDFSARHWDFRGGRERNLASTPRFTSAQDEAVRLAAPQLGLAPSTPSAKHYDVALMTGGMVRAGVVKPRYLRELMDAGLSVDSVVFLGGFRPFAGDEAAVARRLGIAGDNEFDAMQAGLVRVFELSGTPQRESEGKPGENASWLQHSWHRDGVEFSVLAAPSSEPDRRRANTDDTYRFWAGLRRPNGQKSVLVVTTPPYVPYQAAGAVEVLGVECGLSVETVGVSVQASDLGELTQQFATQHYLQEIRSAIRGFRSLSRAVG